MRIQKKYLWLIFALLISVALTVYCDKDSPTKNEVTVVGNWTRDVGAMTITLTLKADGRFEVDTDGDGAADVEGDYTLAGNQITFEDDAGSGCDDPGVYTWDIDGDELTLTIVVDTCAGRENVLGATWTKV